MASPILEITDGTKSINLLSGRHGFGLMEWTPAISQTKDGGTFRSGVSAEGRRLVAYQFDNVIERYDLRLHEESQDLAAYHLQELRRLLEKARQYWTTEYQQDPVYIKARGSLETNTRYALIHDYSTPNDDNPYASPFFNCPDVLADDLTLLIERGAWLKNAPGVGECDEIVSGDEVCFPAYLEFNGDTSKINCGSDASIDDLPASDFTVDGWVYAQSGGEGGLGRIIGKENWLLRWGTSGITAYIDFATTDILVTVSSSPDNKWHHVALVFDSATKVAKIYVDGALQATSAAGSGAYVTDAALNLTIGNNNAGSVGFDGYIGWMRVSNFERWLGNFYSPARCRLPDLDGQTLALWIYENTGTTANNFQGDPALDGTITDGTWHCDCEQFYGSGTVLVENEYAGTFYPAQSTDDTWVDSFDSSINNADVTLVEGFEEPVIAEGHNWTAGIRFRNVNIPPGAIITRAYVRVYNASYQIMSGFGNYSINYYGEDADNANVYSTYADFAGRSITTARVYWAIYSSPASWAVFDTEDLTEIVQEIVSRPGWASGNNLAIRFWRVDGSIADETIFTFDSYDSGNIPELHIEWRLPDDFDIIKEPTCDDVIYVANKNNTAQLTNIHVYNSVAGTYSPNLLYAAPPFNLLPSVPAVGDCIYFAVSAETANGGPFCSLVLDLETAASDITIVWEFWTGAAWSSTFSFDDDTAGFTVTGKNSIHWIQPTTWTPTDVGPMNNVWALRARVSAIGSAPTAPVQQTNIPYTVTWGFVDMESDQIVGDIKAWARMFFENQFFRGSTPVISTNRVLVGLRSYERGDDFTAYINLGNRQNGDKITVTALTGGSIVADNSAATGYALQYSAAGAESDNDFGYVTIDRDLTPQFNGKYHAFLRGTLGTGPADDIKIRMSICGSDNTGVPTVGNPMWTSDLMPVATSYTQYILDVGEITLPPFYGTKRTDFVNDLHFVFYGTNLSGAARAFKLYDLILIPVDEWACDVWQNLIAATPKDWIGENDYIDLDGFSYPKYEFRALSRDSSDNVKAHWVQVANERPMLHPNKRQRLWFFAMSLSAGLGLPNISYCEQTHKVRLFSEERYFSLRGKR